MPSQLLLIGLVLAAGLLVGRFVANRTGIPDAAVYVLLGLAAGFLPGMSDVRLSPDIVLLLFLPPLIHYAAFFSDPRESLRNVVAVLGQAVGLVLVTAGVCAGVLLVMFPDLGWAVALAFGAAIAPPDPVAAGSVLQRVGAPRRLVTVLETEGLINDGVALTVFAVAIGAVGSSLPFGDVAFRFGVEVVGGVLFGLVVGVLVTTLRKRIRDVPSQVLLSVATPYVAFVPAQLVHSSGVLATVTAAVWLGTRGRGLVEPTARLQTETFWKVLNTLLVAVLFLLLGLQVPTIVGVVEGYPLWLLVTASVVVVLAAVLVRLAWVMLLPPVVAPLLPAHDRLADGMPWRERLALGWCGPRGAVSLAVALSIPLVTEAGEPFPRRDLLIFLTIVLVMATPVGQTVPLPALLRRLRLSPEQHELTEGIRARRATVDAALRELDQIASGDDPDRPGAEALRHVLELRRDHLNEQLEEESSRKRGRSDTTELRLQLIGVERHTLHELHDKGTITRGTMLEISQELDLDETRLQQRPRDPVPSEQGE